MRQFTHPALVVVASIALTLSLLACSEQAKMNKAQELVRERLKDPKSAEFRDVKAFTAGAVCGQVNAKNSFGGFPPFLRTLPIGAV